MFGVRFRSYLRPPRIAFAVGTDTPSVFALARIEVKWRPFLSRGVARAIIANAGNANCATRTGDRVALATCRAVARADEDFGRRADQRKAGQVHADHPALAAQRLGPALPGVQAGRGAVQQHDGQRVVARPFVAQVHLHALQRNELRRRRGPLGGEGFDRFVGRPGQVHPQQAKKHHTGHHQAQGTFEKFHPALLIRKLATRIIGIHLLIPCLNEKLPESRYEH